MRHLILHNPVASSIWRTESCRPGNQLNLKIASTRISVDDGRKPYSTCFSLGTEYKRWRSPDNPNYAESFAPATPTVRTPRTAMRDHLRFGITEANVH